MPLVGLIGENGVGVGPGALDRCLIARILRGSVAAALVPEFHATVGGTMLGVRKQGGLRPAFVARQIETDGGEQVVFTTV
jgi:hypothetical protein